MLGIISARLSSGTNLCITLTFHQTIKTYTQETWQFVKAEKTKKAKANFFRPQYCKEHHMNFDYIDVSVYGTQLKNKTEKLIQDFSSVLDIPSPEIFESEPINYRMRAKFCIYLDGKQIKYYMVDTSGKKKEKIFLSQFPTASLLINKLMPKIIQFMEGNETLTNKFFEIDFLTSLSGEALISLVYHKNLDDLWIYEAKELLRKLRGIFPNNKIDLIGRSRKQKILLDKDFITERLTVNQHVYTYKQVENSFTQPNAKVCEKMLEWVQNNTKNLTDTDLLELYCGNGNFSIALAGNFNKILATEISKTSVEAAQINIRDNNVNNLKIIRLSAEEFTQALNKTREFKRLKNNNVNLDDYHCKTVLVDPPRAGVDKETIKLIQHYENIVYISCNPVTLIDNLKTLCLTHKIEKLAFFDQFPYTDEHIETGVILKRKN